MKAVVLVKRVETEFWKGVTVGMSIVALWVALIS